MEISQLVDEETEVINLKGHTVIPGLVDSYVHPGPTGRIKVSTPILGVHRGFSDKTKEKGDIHLI